MDVVVCHASQSTRVVENMENHAVSAKERRRVGEREKTKDVEDRSVNSLDNVLGLLVFLNYF